MNPRTFPAVLQITDRGLIWELEAKPSMSGLCDAWYAIQRIATRSGARLQHIGPYIPEEDPFWGPGPFLSLGCTDERRPDIQLGIAWWDLHGGLNSANLMCDGNRWLIARIGDVPPPGIQIPAELWILRPNTHRALGRHEDPYRVAERICRSFLLASQPN